MPADPQTEYQPSRSSAMSRRLHRSLCCVFASSLLIPALASSQGLNPADYGAAIGGANERARKLSAEVPGMTVAVAVDGTIVWSEAFGYADLSSKRPTCRLTRFRIGSISKCLTAAGLMRMVERGEVDLDGGSHGGTASLLIRPRTRVVIALLCNLSESSVIDDSMVIADLFDLSAGKNAQGHGRGR